jgi:hypothetical protein
MRFLSSDRDCPRGTDGVGTPLTPHFRKRERERRAQGSEVGAQARDACHTPIERLGQARGQRCGEVFDEEFASVEAGLGLTARVRLRHWPR